jgi:hypothetical protein
MGITQQLLPSKHWRLNCYQGRERATLCKFDQTGARAFRQNVESLSNQRSFVHTICTAGWSEIRRGMGNFENALSRNVGYIRLFFYEKADFCKGCDEECWTIRRTQPGASRTRHREVLGIAQRQGITPADFVRMLDSGMRMSDFPTATDPFTNADRAIDCDCSFRDGWSASS